MSPFFILRPGHGSFLRPHKLDFGIGIIQALEMRYGLGCDVIKETDMYVVGTNSQKTAVEMVGFEKVQKTQRLVNCKFVMSINLELQK